MNAKEWRKVSTLGFLVTLVVFVLIGVFAANSKHYWKLTNEKVQLVLRPDAQKAASLGSYHFYSRNGEAYDIDAAKYFYEKSLRLDPSIPWVRHQLGRIAFVQGDLPYALHMTNREIARFGASTTPSSYYMRGLILGYMGAYSEAAKAYEKYLEIANPSWAALNDYSWVLLKDGRPDKALSVLSTGLELYPSSPWILNSYAIALSELGRYEEALGYAKRALAGMDTVTREQWLSAYPGNDPRHVDAGIATLRNSIQGNILSIEEKISAQK